MFSDDFKNRLDSVPWDRYEHGITGPIVDNIMGLMSDSPAKREKHLRRLEMNLLPQDNLCEAAYYAIPFLLEMIQHEQAREVVYELLLTMVICSQPDAYDTKICLDGASCSLTLACRRRLAEGIPYYLRDVRDSNLSTACRGDALSIVCRLRDWSKEWLPAIRKAHDEESAPEMRQLIEEWLSDELE